LRKDYPLTGIHLPEPHWGGQVLLDESLPTGMGRQTLRTTDRTAVPRSDNLAPDTPEDGTPGASNDTPANDDAR
jgi:hypothetical protein